jgi:hypothetical protein
MTASSPMRARVVWFVPKPDLGAGILGAGLVVGFVCQDSIAADSANEIFYASTCFSFDTMLLISLDGMGDCRH